MTTQDSVLTRALAIISNERISEIRRKSALPSKVVRQTRYDGKAIGCTLTIADEVFSVANYSAFGISILSPRAFDHTTISATLSLRGIFIENITALKVREETTPEGGYLLCYKLVGGVIDTNRILAVANAQATIMAHKTSLDAVNNRVSPEFAAKIYEIKDALEELEKLVNGIGGTEESQNKALSFERDVANIVSGYIKDIMQPFYDEILRMTDHMSPEQIAACRRFIKDKLGRVLYQSPFAQRALNKPLGYAGDFESMNILYRDEPLGRSLFAKSLHKYYVDDPNSRAVRNRAEYLKGVLLAKIRGRRAGGAIKILSVACGPAFEVQMLLPDLVAADKVEFTFLDQDARALENAQYSISITLQNLGLDIPCRYVHKSIKDLISNPADIGEYDLIYSAGLFDYFSDRVAQKAAECLFSMTAPGGQLIIGNFVDTASSRAMMSLALDWTLVYRTELDLRRLYGSITQKLNIEKEPEGINLFCRLERSSAPDLVAK